MPAKVVIVLTEPGVAQEVANLLPLGASDVLVLSNSMAALNALERAATIEVLVTCANFGPGQPNGASLALMARARRPYIIVLFIGEPAHEQLVSDMGVFLASPITASEIAEAIEGVLAPEPPLTA